MGETLVAVTPIKVPGTEELPAHQVEVHMFSKHYGVEIPSRRFLDRRYTMRTAALVMLSQAKLGVCNSSKLVADPSNADYRYYRSCRFYYAPYLLSTIFTREELPQNIKHYHLSLCFVNQSEFLLYNVNIATQLCEALFRHRAWSIIARKGGCPGQGQLVMHYRLQVGDWDEL